MNVNGSNRVNGHLLRGLDMPKKFTGPWESSDTSTRSARLGRLQRELGARYARCTLENYKVLHETQQEVFERITYVAANLSQFIHQGRNLILYGTVGTGKDHLVSALLQIAAGTLGIDARMLDGQKWIMDRRDRIGRKQDEGSLIEQYAHCPALGISDPIPPRRMPSGGNIDMLFLLINRRYQKGFGTWVTLNARDEDDARRKLSDPVWSRLCDSAEIYHMEWPDFRKPNRVIE